MILELIQPIKKNIDIKDQVPDTCLVFKDMKKISIAQAISSKTGIKYNFDDIKDRIKYSAFTNTQHVFYLDGKPLLKFTPTDIKVTDTDIICRLEYIPLYQKARN